MLWDALERGSHNVLFVFLDASTSSMFILRGNSRAFRCSGHFRPQNLMAGEAIWKALLEASGTCWNLTREWFEQCNASPFPPFMGLSLLLQKLDEMDKAAWERIEEQEVARVQIWHTKQGVYRKKILPDVRDDLMGDPANEV